jgi:starch-binding outer membrane protein, SusD/RagB family
MKRRYSYIILLSTLSLSSCSKFLDKEPDNRTNVKTSEQLSQLLTSAYPHASYILFTESMSDNAEDKEGGGSGYDFVDRINAQSYRYNVVEESPDANDGPDYYWTACYKAIGAANQALQIIDRSDDPASLSAQRGEALLARAYAHFMLVTLFANVYDPTTAASDPGIPYVLVPETETFEKYERKTVAFVYDMIEKDLTEGYPLINDQIYGNAPKFHFNKRAAAAFAARFYLFKQDYARVITYASAALGSSATENLRPWNTVLTDLQYYELQAEYTKSTTKGNLLLQEALSIWGRSYPSIRYGLGDKVGNEVLFRSNVSGGFYAYDVYGANPQVYNIPKFYEHFVRKDINANTGDPYNTIPLLTGEEALLNRAEAYVRTNNPNLAAQDLNAFISQNIDNYDPFVNKVTPSKCGSFYNTSSSNGLLLATLDFKRAFFMHEGLRWLDILRLRIPVTHETSDGQVIELGPTDNRRVLQLPALTKEAGLEPNPR